jgi:hypothetical protein
MPSGVREAGVPKLALAVVVVVLVLHGLIHLIGTTVYLKLADIQGFTYKTTLVGGRLDVGDAGIRLFGAMWILPALGFIGAAAALSAGWEWWRPVLLVTTLLSLALTTLDWSVAFAGAIVNLVVLVLLWLGPRVVGQVS